MDPNTALQLLRENTRKGVSLGATRNELRDRLFDVIEQFEALDTWLCRGGFLPTDWADAQEADKAALRAALNRPAYQEDSE